MKEKWHKGELQVGEVVNWEKKEGLYDSKSLEEEPKQSMKAWKAKHDALEEKQDKQAGRKDVTWKRAQNNKNVFLVKIWHVQGKYVTILNSSELGEVFKSPVGEDFIFSNSQRIHNNTSKKAEFLINIEAYWPCCQVLFLDQDVLRVTVCREQFNNLFVELSVIEAQQILLKVSGLCC